jgi:hypothetical protein
MKIIVLVIKFKAARFQLNKPLSKHLILRTISTIYKNLRNLSEILCSVQNVTNLPLLSLCLHVYHVTDKIITVGVRTRQRKMKVRLDTH